MTKTYTWWKDATIYQIWPASYKDSNGDGIGDIPGIISKLDYIKKLGADVIWLSPMYDSPQDDMGYDISDYNAIYPKYGTMKDMENLIEGCHARGMKIICDLVINHTSAEHAWFKESRSSKTNPKRDWYIWKPAKYDEQGNRHPPNNWRSFFSESAWQYDETTDEYYLKLFAKTQPDLNWENEETRKAIYDTALKYWFEKGVDGFRIDTSGLYSKVQTFEDAPIVVPNSEFQPPGRLVENGPRIHEFHKEMFKSVTSKYDVMTVGEAGLCSREDALKFVSSKEAEMNMIFLFNLVCVGANPKLRFYYDGYKLTDLKNAIKFQCDFVKGTDAWSTVFTENHDQPRCVSRFGDTSSVKNTFKSAKLISMLQTCLTGTLYIYQGQEIAMTNVPRSWPVEEYLDIDTINAYKSLFNRNKDITDENDPRVQEFLDGIAMLARDHARTPVQWSDKEFGGFSESKPWMRVNDNYKDINVEAQENDPNSVFSFYRNSLELRKQYKDLMVYGDFEILDHSNEKVFSFTKTNGSEKAFITLNFSNESVPFDQLVLGELELINSNVESPSEMLTPWEGRVYLVK